MKPAIIILSSDQEDTVRWLSDGWYSTRQRYTHEAQILMDKANRCIEEGTDHQDVIRRLTDAGFEVRRV